MRYFSLVILCALLFSACAGTTNSERPRPSLADYGTGKLDVEDEAYLKEIFRLQVEGYRQRDEVKKEKGRQRARKDFEQMKLMPPALERIEVPVLSKSENPDKKAEEIRGGTIERPKRQFENSGDMERFIIRPGTANLNSTGDISCQPSQTRKASEDAACQKFFQGSRTNLKSESPTPNQGFDLKSEVPVDKVGQYDWNKDYRDRVIPGWEEEK